MGTTASALDAVLPWSVLEHQVVENDGLST